MKNNIIPFENQINHLEDLNVFNDPALIDSFNQFGLDINSDFSELFDGTNNPHLE